MSSLKSGSGGGGGVCAYIFQLILWFFTYIKNALMGVFGGGGGSGGQDQSRENSELPDIRRER